MEADTQFAGQRLAIFLPSLVAGGAESVMVTLANAFAARGVEIDILLARATGHHLTRLSDSIRVTELGGAGVARAFPGLVSFLRRTSPDVLLSAMTHANVVAAAAAQLALGRVGRIVLSERMSLAARSNYYISARERLLKSAMRVAYRRASTIIVPSKDMIEPLRRHLRLPADRLAAIPNPVVDAEFASRTSQSWPLGKRLRADGSRIVLAVGRLTGVKGYENLIAAFTPIAEERQVHLVILGEGEERARLEALAAARGISARVHLPGFDPNPLAAMARADVFVLSSYFEGLPNVLIQALACGTRVVSTDCPTGPSEILEGGRWGRLVPVGNSGELRRGIEDALDAHAWPDGRPRGLDFREEGAVTAYLKTLFPEACR